MSRIRRSPIQFTMRGTLVAWGLALALLPILVIGIPVYLSTARVLEARIQEDLARTAQTQAVSFDGRLDRLTIDAQTIAANEQVQSMRSEQMTDALMAFGRLWRQYHGLVVIDANGYYLASNLATPASLKTARVNIRHRTHFRRAMRGETVIIDPIQQVTGLGLMAGVSTPINRHGHIVGVASVGIATDDIATFFAGAAIGETGDIYLVNRRHSLISPSRFTVRLRNQGLIKTRSEYELRAKTVGAGEALAGRAGVRRYEDFRGRQVLGAYAPILHTGWALLVEQDLQEAYAPLTRLRTTALLVGLGYMLCIGACVWLMSFLLTRDVTALTRTAQAIQSGDLMAHAHVTDFSDLVKMADVLHAMASRIHILENALQRQDTERTTASEALKVSLTERTRLEQALTMVNEEERRRLGAMLHDGLCQLLTGALLRCTALERQIARQEALTSADLLVLTSLLEQSISEAYDIAKGLCPVDLNPESLLPALHRLCQRTESTFEIGCELHLTGDTSIPDRDTALHLYRIAQEAIYNAVKHANARHIVLELRGDQELLLLRVRDDGIGIPQAGITHGGMGLLMMTHRVRMLGGTLQIECPPEGGTLVTCRIPHDHALAREEQPIDAY